MWLPKTEIACLNLCIFWLFALQIFHPSLALSVVRSNEIDRLSLLAFKAKITRDPLGVLSLWNKSAHFCEWSGVICGHRHRRVTGLNLSSCGFVGGLTPHIGNMSFLRMLDLRNNTFLHEIPQELSLLSRLQKLGLSNNSFSGEIPENLSRCSNLQYLDLGNNKLSGKLPAELGLLRNLQVLLFNGNNLTGELPTSFSNLTSLEYLSGTTNKIHGNIPDSFGQLRKLNFFSFQENSLTGLIPSSIFNLSFITVFAVSVNQLHGTLPSDLGLTLPNVEIFEIAENQFSGAIPVTLSNSSNLLYLELAENKFSGKVPSLASVMNLQYLQLFGNQLGNGENDDLNFLHDLLNCTTLQLLDVSYNNFTGNKIYGNIPNGIGNLINLEQLGLETNQLTGPIPSSIGKLQKIGYLNLHTNQLSGNIPLSLGNITFLESLSLAKNYLNGSIPSSLGRCKHLLGVDVSQNELSGTIPKEIMSISSLSVVLYLSENQLFGPIPREVGNLVNLGNLDFSDNRLSGEIPGSLGSCKSLENMYLRQNFLQGTIPHSLSSLRAIQTLDLSYNNLTGQIPEFLGEFKLLKNLNLSFNNLEGEVPDNFKNASNVSLSGNYKLCSGISKLHLPTCSTKQIKRKHIPPLKLIVPVVSGIFLLIIAMLALIIFRLWRKIKKTTSPPPELLGSFLQVSYDDLLKATNGFSVENLVGTGRFGSVYKGIFDGGKAVAVKVLKLQHPGATKSFMAGCEAMRNVRHRNLVKIVTACASIDFQGNDFKALVYELMVNGSLEEWLHPGHQKGESRESPRNLNLLDRLNIVMDVASALVYLHLHCQPSIVHCDIKPSNVLIDGEMIAHLGDFGMARFLQEAPENTNFNSTSTIGILGSMGYTAPEYAMGSKVSTSGDIYSFGILLLEMFTGKRPTDELFKDGLNLCHYVESALPEKLSAITDPALVVDRENGSIQVKENMSCDEIKECLISIFRIGVSCSAELARDRMNISKAEAQLHSIRNKLAKGRRQG